MKQKFYKCAHCGNIIEKIEDKGVPVVCCGEAMQELVPGAVGSVEHPMLEEHFIEWISLTTQSGTQRKHLKPGEKPEVCFALAAGDAVEAVYAYCTLHGLWEA